MLTYHQCGHNFVWNVQSVLQDGAGAGLIISPVNVEADRIRDRIPEPLLSQSWIDPQFYLPHDNKGNLATYPFFPKNILPDFTTADYESYAIEVARECLAFQAGLGMKYCVIPTRYFDDLPEAHLDQLSELFVNPFIEAHREAGLTQPLLLTVIAKPLHLEPGIVRDELLTWCTNYEGIAGVYLVFDNAFYTKQIKDPGYLAGQMRFINALRQNGLEVHVGYSGLEGLVLSVADPTSVSMGSFENLRSFGVLRLETREKTTRRGPRARVYSGRLLQSIEDTMLPPLRELVPRWTELFDDSPYKDYLLDPETSLSFQKSEVYKHYFYVFARQVHELPAVQERVSYWEQRATEAIAAFEGIRGAGVYLDSDSDQSHLPAWLNALAMFRARPE
jgi:hypothetical protein